MRFGGASGAMGAGMASGSRHPIESDAASAALGYLNSIRHAIQRYKDDHGGALPGVNGMFGELEEDLKPYLNPFPRCPVVNTNNSVSPTTGPPMPDFSGKGWAYSYDMGMVIINTSATDAHGTPFSSY